MKSDFCICEAFSQMILIDKCVIPVQFRNLLSHTESKQSTLYSCVIPSKNLTADLMEVKCITSFQIGVIHNIPMATLPIVLLIVNTIDSSTLDYELYFLLIQYLLMLYTTILVYILKEISRIRYYSNNVDHICNIILRSSPSQKAHWC